MSKTLVLAATALLGAVAFAACGSTAPRHPSADSSAATAPPGTGAGSVMAAALVPKSGPSGFTESNALETYHSVSEMVSGFSNPTQAGQELRQDGFVQAVDAYWADPATDEGVYLDITELGSPRKAQSFVTYLESFSKGDASPDLPKLPVPTVAVEGFIGGSSEQTAFELFRIGSWIFEASVLANNPEQPLQISAFGQFVVRGYQTAVRLIDPRDTHR